MLHEFQEAIKHDSLKKKKTIYQNKSKAHQNNNWQRFDEMLKETFSVMTI